MYQAPTWIKPFLDSEFSDPDEMYSKKVSVLKYYADNISSVIIGDYYQKSYAEEIKVYGITKMMVDQNILTDTKLLSDPSPHDEITTRFNELAEYFKQLVLGNINQ